MAKEAVSAISGRVITPSDTVNLTQITQGLYVGVSGSVRVLLKGDTDAVTFTGLAGGMIHPISAKRVYATGTTATSILGVY